MQAWRHQNGTRNPVTSPMRVDRPVERRKTQHGVHQISDGWKRVVSWLVPLTADE